MARPKGPMAADEKSARKVRMQQVWNGFTNEQKQQAKQNMIQGRKNQSEEHKQEVRDKISLSNSKSHFSEAQLAADEKAREHVGDNRTEAQREAARLHSIRMTEHRTAEQLAQDLEMSLKQTGVLVGPYKGGVEYTEGTIRSSSTRRHEKFKLDVLERDQRRCQYPGCDVTQQQLDEVFSGFPRFSSNTLNVHHKRPWAKFEQFYRSNLDLYFDPAGAVTYCNKHHILEDKRLSELTLKEIEDEIRTGRQHPIRI